MVALHAKDFVVENNIIRTVPAGTGKLNYELIFKRLKEKKPYIHILIEDIKEEYMGGTMRFITEVYEKV